MADMTGEEFKEALDNGLETGRQLIEEITNTVLYGLAASCSCFCSVCTGTWLCNLGCLRKCLGHCGEHIEGARLRNANGWAQRSELRE